MFQNLLFHELVLIIAGSIVLIALVFALLWNIVKGKAYGGLLFFFLLPLVMIGFPAIQSISLSKDKIEISKQTAELKDNPADTAAKNALQISVDNMNIDRIKNDPGALLQYADAQYALGNYDTALYFVDESLQIEENNIEALQLKEEIIKQKTIETKFNSDIRLLNENLRIIESSPEEATPERLSIISSTLSDIQKPVYADETSALTIAKSLIIIDETEKAMETINQIMETKPESVKAEELKVEIEAGQMRTFTIEDADKQKLNNSELFKPDSQNKMVIIHK